MRKKILIACNNLHIGGIQRALINLLNEISDKHNVTLFLFSRGGEYEPPKGIKVIYGNKFTEIMGMSQKEAAGSGIFCKLWRTLWAGLTRIFGCRFSFGVLCSLQKLPEQYDIAISYMQNSAFRYFYGGCNEFVIKSVSAERKISFVHCDFENYFGNNAYNRSFYRCFDAIACVSDSCKKNFEKVCPELSEKTITVHNCCNFEEMQELALAFTPERTAGKINIFTSARISEEKGIFRMIDIFFKLKSEGFEFIWRIAGDGALYEKAVKSCLEKGLESNIIFLGAQKNPYPYFKNSDLLLVPSYNEAAPMVFGEAQSFGLPILTTDTTSADELVGKTKTGFVCENSDKGIENALRKILNNPDLLKRYAPTGSNTNASEEFGRLISEKQKGSEST